MRRADRLEHHVDSPQHVDVPEPQDPPAVIDLVATHHVGRRASAHQAQHVRRRRLRRRGAAKGSARSDDRTDRSGAGVGSGTPRQPCPKAAPQSSLGGVSSVEGARARSRGLRLRCTQRAVKDRAARLAPHPDPLPAGAGRGCDALEDKLDALPNRPGVYLMKDRARPRSSTSARPSTCATACAATSPAARRTRAPSCSCSIGVLGDLETVVVTTEKEALLLENELIKKHRPRFNVQLRDDKNFLCLRLDTRAPVPAPRDGAPLRSRTARATSAPTPRPPSIRETLRVVNRYFQLRTCTDHVAREPQAPVPAVPDRPLPRALRAPRLRRGLPEQRRRGGAVPRGRAAGRWSDSCARA